MDKESTDWSLLLKELAASEFDFLVVGGGAMVLHGIPRTTLDLDVYVPVDDLQLSSLIDFLTNKLKLVSRNEINLNMGADLLLGQWLFFSVPNGPDIIDVYLCRSGEYHSLLESADFIDIDGHEVAVASLETLREMKEQTGRAIDLADLALIDEFKDISN